MNLQNSNLSSIKHLILQLLTMLSQIEDFFPQIAFALIIFLLCFNHR